MKMSGVIILKVRLFLHCKFNSCHVLIADLGSKSSVVKNKRNDHAGCMLILDITIDN